MTDMSRRQFSSALGLGTLAAGLAAASAPALANAAAPARKGGRIEAKHRKEWARDVYKGMVNIQPPSMTPDFKGIDEQGVRNDIKLAIDQGFVATLCSQYTVGIDKAEQKKVVEAACAEGVGKIEVSASIIAPLDEALELTAHAEKAGCSHILLIAPPPLYKESEDALFNYYKTVAESTDMGIIVQYYNDKLSRKWHPAGLSMNVFDRVADLPNVVGMKLTQIIDPGLAYEIADRIGKKILIGSAELSLVPFLSSVCRTQWAGMFAADCVQAPSHQNAVEFMRLIATTDKEKAMKAYWALQPAVKAFYEMQAPSLAKGGHPWNQIKYCKWLIGGNGGLIRTPAYGENAGLLPVVDDESMPPLDAKQREWIKSIYRNMGVKLEDRPEEEFLVGRAAYARGVRAKDLTARFAYS